MCTQPMPAAILFGAKSGKIFQDAIMLVILIKIDLHLLKVTQLLLSKKYCYCNEVIILLKE